MEKLPGSLAFCCLETLPLLDLASLHFVSRRLHCLVSGFLERTPRMVVGEIPGAEPFRHAQRFMWHRLCRKARNLRSLTVVDPLVCSSSLSRIDAINHWNDRAGASKPAGVAIDQQRGQAMLFGLIQNNLATIRECLVEPWLMSPTLLLVLAQCPRLESLDLRTIRVCRWRRATLEAGLIAIVQQCRFLSKLVLPATFDELDVPGLSSATVETLLAGFFFLLVLVALFHSKQGVGE